MATLTALSVRDRIVHRLEASVGSERYRRYFDESVRLDISGTGREVRVDASTPFMADLLRKRFGEQIRAAALHETGEGEVDVHFGVSSSPTRPGHAVAGGETGRNERAEAGRDRVDGPPGSRTPPPHHDAMSPGAGVSPPAPAPVRPRHGTRPDGRAWRNSPRQTKRLDTFVVGESNRLAHHAAERLAGKECPPGFSPLFIHGACGLGKTHLLQGLADLYRRTHPGARVVSTTGEAFTNSFLTALRTNKVDEFRRNYRNVSLLCIDDIHFLSNKSATQREFLHTFNAIGLEGALVALVSDEHPSKIQSFTRELVSRFLAGMVVKLEAPDREMRLEFVRRLAARNGLAIDEAAMALVVSRPVESMRELEGLVTKIGALTRFAPGARGENDRIGVELARQALGPMGPMRPTRPMRLDSIMTHVCAELRVDMGDMLGRGRHKRVVLARSMIALLSRRLTTLSFPEIARGMGRPNHSTIVTACKRMEREIERGAPCDAGTDLDGISVAELADRLARGAIRLAGE